MTTLFDEQFYTDDFDQEILDFITSKGWGLKSEYSNKPNLSDNYLVYGNGTDRFWTSHFNDKFLQLTKEAFKEKIGMTTVQKKLKPSDVKGYVRGKHHPYTDFNQEIADWLKVNSDVTDFDDESNRYIFTGCDSFYSHYIVDDDEVYYTNDEYKKLIGMDDTPNVSDTLVSTKQQLDELYKSDPVVVRQYLKELATREDNIRKELEFAEAKKARLEKHIDILKSKLQ